jgi:Ca2+-binding RTX toxin-like protein
MPSYFRAGSEFAVNQVTTNNQTGVRVSSLPGNRYIIIWSSDASVANQADIIGRIFNSDGTPASGEFVVNTQTAAHQATPDVVALSNGNFVVTWVDYNAASDGDNTCIKAQIFDTNGVPIGGEFLVNVGTAGRQDSAEVSALSNGGFVITWDDLPSTDQFGRIYDAGGQAVSGAIRLNTNLTATQSSGEVIGLNNGNFLVVWRSTDTTADGDSNALKAQIFDPTGNMVGGEFRINTAGLGSQITPAITVLSNGNFVVAWQSGDATQDGSSSAIKAQLFAPDGSKIGGEFLVNTFGQDVQNAPTITALPDGGYFIAWFTNDPTQDGNLGAIKGQFFTAAGVRVGSEILLNTVTTGSQSQPSIAANADGSILVTWVTQAVSFGEQNIRGQVFRANDAPVIISNGGGDTALVEITENSSTVTQVAATDAFGTQAVSYTITGGADAALFTINATTGALSLITTADFELPGDSDSNNVYEVVVQASDGDLSDTQLILVSVTNVNEAPDITSNGGGANATVNVSENGTAVTTVAAGDVDGPSLTFAVSGGADAALFAIDPVTGVLSLVAAPNFEAPIDADGDNVYDVIVSVSDGYLIDTQSLLISVGNADEAPEILSGGGGATAALAIGENETAVTQVNGTDPDGNQPDYAIAGGADAALFTIDQVTGALSFLSAPDHETPADADGDNVYEVVVSASDGLLTDTQAISVTVTNANEAPVITSNGAGVTAAVTIDENQLAVATVASTDADGNPRSYSIVGGADAARFTIDAVTGALSLINAANFEAPGDVGANNVYDVIVEANDGSLSDTQAIAVTIANVNEAPVITSNGGGASAVIQTTENSRLLPSIQATDAEGSAITYSIVGGADAARFTLNATSGQLLFAASPNYEAPVDAGGNNVYDIIVQASDGVTVTTQTLAIAVNNLTDGATINGTNGGNTLTGTNAEDTIDGFGGNDTIIGGLGADRLFGGAGADRFVYNSIADSPTGSTFNPLSGATVSNMDSIRDFSRSQGDRISLSAIDANTAVAGNQAFAFIGTAAFSNVAGQLRYSQANGTTIVSGDINGDGVADFAIELNGVVNLQSGDFIL